MVCVIGVHANKTLWGSTQCGMSSHVDVQCSLKVCAELGPIKLS